MDCILSQCKKPVTAKSKVLTIHEDAKFARSIRCLTVSIDYQKLSKTFYWRFFFGDCSINLLYWYIRARCIGYDGSLTYDTFILPNMDEEEIPDEIKRILLHWHQKK